MSQKRLSDADGVKIDDERTPRGISQILANRVMSLIPEHVNIHGPTLHAGRDSHHTHYGGESDGLASTVRTAFEPNTWAEIASLTEYQPRNIPDDTLKGIVGLAQDDNEPTRHLGRFLACVGERYARVSSEHALAQCFDDAKVAELKYETENVDMTCGDGKVQVYTGTSDKYWRNKSKAPEASKKVADMNYEKAVEQTNFDVFVFVRIVEGSFYVGAKTIANENEKSAPAKAKP